VRRVIIPILLAAALGLLAACGDDTTSPDNAAAVTVRVVDPAGDPVEGLDLMVVMDSPYYQGAKSADKAVTGIRFLLPIRSMAALTVEDVAGGHIRTLVVDTLPAGAYTVMWDGRDDEGVPQYSGLYRVRMVAGQDLAAPDTTMVQPMYMALIDYDQATLGTTDAAGEIVLRDKRLFPALYGPVDMKALDENGDELGDFPVTSTMRFYLRDAELMLDTVALRDVVRSNQTVELVWTGIAPAAAAPEPPAPPAPAADKGVPPAGGYALRQPCPNPFN